MEIIPAVNKDMKKLEMTLDDRTRRHEKKLKKGPHAKDIQNTASHIEA